jgi:hypothetical protein
MTIGAVMGMNSETQAEQGMSETFAQNRLERARALDLAGNTEAAVAEIVELLRSNLRGVEGVEEERLHASAHRLLLLLASDER